MWISWLLLDIFGSSIYFITNPSPIISKRCCRPCPTCKWSKILCRCKIHYWIVRCCRRQPNNRPPRFDGYFFPSPYCTKHWRWRSGRAHAKSLFKRHWVDEFLSGCKNGYCPWVSEGVSKTDRDRLCDDENGDFLQLQILLSSFTKLDHVANVSDLTQRAIFCVARY